MHFRWDVLSLFNLCLHHLEQTCQHLRQNSFIIHSDSLFSHLFFQSKMLMLKSYQSFSCVMSVHTPLRHDIKHSSKQYSVGSSNRRRRGWGNEKQPNSATAKKIIHEYQHHGLCAALKCPFNGRYLSQAPVAISANHTVLAFICPSDAVSCRNGCQRKKKEKNCAPINTKRASHRVPLPCNYCSVCSDCNIVYLCVRCPLEHTACLVHCILWMGFCR